MDLRPYTAALANKAARGGGYEYEGTSWRIVRGITRAKKMSDVRLL